MNSSLVLVDFTQDLPAQGWCRMPQPQHVGQVFNPAPTKSGQDDVARAHVRKGDAHFSLGGMISMEPRQPQGPDRPD